MCDCQLAVKIVLELCIGILHDVHAVCFQSNCHVVFAWVGNEVRVVMVLVLRFSRWLHVRTIHCRRQRQAYRRQR